MTPILALRPPEVMLRLSLLARTNASMAFVRANKLNRNITSGGRSAKIGVITVGKSYLDVREALDELGIDEVKCNDLGIRLYKVACPWPLSQRELMEFAQGLDLIIVVEEKRSLIEVQVREELYGTANQPVCIGKRDERGNWLFPVKGALDPNDIAVCIGERLLERGRNEALAAKVARLKERQRALAEMADVATRTPYFCSGCPHNSSTVVPEGMRAYAGIGCHFMAQWMDRSTLGYTQMGGEGANWIGEAPFSNRGHVFQNLGDGTYNHSGYLALRAAIVSGVNITYKILFNDAVAMTGGQPNEGGLSVPEIARQVAAAGVKRLVVVTDEPWKYPADVGWPRGVTVHHRDELMRVQTELASVEGASVLIYDQTCAAEKRRRRKRGLYPDPDKRVIINELVCEGCGDCGVQSNCVSVQPLETEFGRQRRIIANLAEILPGDFTRDADFSLPAERIKRAIKTSAGEDRSHFVDATRLATALLGNSIGANIFLVGYAYQLGAIPLSAAAIEKAIELNGEAVAMNQAAFRWGRRAAVDLQQVEKSARPA